MSITPAFDITDSLKLLSALQEIDISRAFDDALESQGQTLDRLMRSHIKDIESETLYAQSYVGKKKPYSGKIVVQGEDFGRDSGLAHDSWLNSLKIENGEISWQSVVPYMGNVEEKIIDRSFSEGYGLTDEAIEPIIQEAIASAWQILMQS